MLTKLLTRFDPEQYRVQQNAADLATPSEHEPLVTAPPRCASVVKSPIYVLLSGQQAEGGTIVRPNLMFTLMRFHKLFVVVGVLGTATLMGAQQAPDPAPQPNTTPFIVDQTQAETPETQAAPTAVPNTSFPVSP